ncbi:hypothetical protein AK812_SmicGene28535 [Symbiodinium microadriaticum]|uniref:Uncharacterized protein n=1 Tax=Symbiodinium microadriaticum TaxID=2951 RepID=A0A1Q9D444_SYMMI|nr:hypothetical protein AK812_SmicGene28535 [Symbiodinium microadriaticum]
MWDIDSHAALTSDVAEPSNLHFPNSCYRPTVKAVSVEDYTDWASLKQKAWEFAESPYKGSESLDFICPSWWNATGCECECADCTVLFTQCPVGFMLFRSLSLLCASKDNKNQRWHGLVRKRWGRGLLDLARLRLGFADIIASGWPYFGVLARIGDQLRLDGVTEEFATALIEHAAEPQSLASGQEAIGPSMCEHRGFRQNSGFQQEAVEAISSERPVVLQQSIEAGLESENCPLQSFI